MKTLLKSLLFAVIAAFGVPAFAAPENHEEFARQYMPESQAVFERFRKDYAETQKLRESLVEDLRVMNRPCEVKTNHFRKIFSEKHYLISRPLEADVGFSALSKKIAELEAQESNWASLIKDLFLKHKAGMITSENLSDTDAELAKKSIAWENDVLKNLIKNSVAMFGVPVTVKIPGKDYAFGKYEVTQAQYAAVMGTHLSEFRGMNNPAENVSWDDAQTFCELLTLREQLAGRIGMIQRYRLPTKEEWEHACVDDRLPYDDELAMKDAWYYRNSEGTHHPVGEKKPNLYGIHDMFGNVGEWVASVYQNPYLREDYGYVCKGGDFFGRADLYDFQDAHYRYERSAYGYAKQTKRFPFIGFRVVLTCKEKDTEGETQNSLTGMLEQAPIEELIQLKVKIQKSLGVPEIKKKELLKEIQKAIDAKQK